MPLSVGSTSQLNKLQQLFQTEQQQQLMQYMPQTTQALGALATTPTSTYEAIDWNKRIREMVDKPIEKSLRDSLMGLQHSAERHSMGRLMEEANLMGQASTQRQQGRADEMMNQRQLQLAGAESGLGLQMQALGAMGQAMQAPLVSSQETIMQK